MTDLRGLIERVEKATGPSPEIDALIVAALNHARLKPYPPTDDFGPRNKWQFWSLDGEHFLGNEATPKFKITPVTASVDAALAFSEKVLEDFAYSLVNDYGGYNRAEIDIAPGCKGYPVDGATFKAVADTMPLALVLATLRALDNQGVGE